MLVHSLVYASKLSSGPSIPICVISMIIEDEQVLFFWSMLSIGVEDDASQDLLREIIDKWLSIRGFAAVQRIN